MTKLHVDMTELWPVYEIVESSDGATFILEVDEDEAEHWSRKLHQARRILSDFRDYVQVTDTETSEARQARIETFREKQQVEWAKECAREVKPQRPGCTAPSNNARRR